MLFVLAVVFGYTTFQWGGVCVTEGSPTASSGSVLRPIPSAGTSYIRLGAGRSEVGFRSLSALTSGAFQYHLPVAPELAGKIAAALMGLRSMPTRIMSIRNVGGILRISGRVQLVHIGNLKSCRRWWTKKRLLDRI